MDDGFDRDLVRDRYEPVEVLGRGGQGEVLRALDHQHGRWVALKIRPAPDPDQRQSLLTEARILLTLRPHPNLPLVREDFFWRDSYVLVMDWVDGIDLAQLVIDTGDPGLPVTSVVAYLTQVGDALSHLHAQGVVHGDVKPANLVLTPDGRVVLVDFGVSQRPGDVSAIALGSPGYAAPELAAGQHLSSAADVYSLAATAVALLTGAPPTEGRPDWEGVPNSGAIERALRRGLAIDPSRRPRTTVELVERLRAHLALDLPTGVVTFLLTDIEGSTALWEEDADEMADMLARHDAIIADAVESHGGRLLKTRGEGDATFSVFARASDGVTAAIAAQRQLAGGLGLAVRMALHTGEAQVRDGDYYGRTVNRAARLRSVARGGQILLSAAAADLVVDGLADGVALDDLGDQALRDLTRPEHVYALLHPPPDPTERRPPVRRAAPAFPRPPVDAATLPARPAVDAPTIPPVGTVEVPAGAGELEGRGPELGLVRQAIVDAASGEARVVLVAGEVGVGALDLERLAERARGVALGSSQPGLPASLLVGRTNPFVGRRDELARLAAAWTEAAAGRRQLVLVAGEPGIGKTRLAAEAAAAAHAKGALVLHGRCDEDLGVPYQPFVTALASLLAVTPTGHRLRLGRLAGDLTRLVPEIAARVPDLPPPLRADPETEQYRLFDAVAGWLDATAEEAPLVLVLDDLHWATRPTLQLLRHVARMPAPARLLIVGTYRDTELERDHPLDELLSDLHRLPGLERIGLRGFTETDVADFLEAGAGHPLGAEGRSLARTLHSETNGNPFFVREVVRHLVEIGAVVPTTDGWRVASPVDRGGVPDGVREVVARRLSRLAPATNRVLETAAVIGPEFDLGVLQEATALDESSVLAALEEAIGARLVFETEPMRFRFAHALVRSTLYDELARARRIRAHQRIGEAIEHHYSDRLDEHLAGLAHHFAEAAAAGEGSKAVEYTTRAGDLALERLAHEEAVALYELATDLLITTAEPIDEQRRCRLMISLGEAQRRAGRPEYRDTLLGAARLALRWRDADLVTQAALANNRTTFSAVGEVDTERVVILEAALGLVGDDDSPVRARLLAHLAVELSFSGDWDRRIALSDDAVAMSRRVGDPATLAEVLVLRSPTIWHAATLQERLAIASEQADLAAALGDPTLALHAAVNGIHAALEAGDAALAESRLDLANALARELGQPTLRWLVTFQSARWAAINGDFEAAERLATEALELGEAAGQPDAFAAFAAQLFMIRTFEGRLDEIIELVEQAATANPDLPGFRTALAQCLVEVGRDDEARGHYEVLAAAGFAALPRNATWIIGMTMGAYVCARLGDVARAEHLLDLLTPYRDQFASDRQTWGGSVRYFVALLEATLGRWDDADASFAAAADAHDRIGARPLLAMTRLDHAEMLVRRGLPGDTNRARGLLASALAIAEAHSMRSVVARARRLATDAPRC